ncbi:MAG: Gfo/Idh/MocA family oxidoreductase [Capsulimonadales bacterium]|nr:Gfo/Idh/MocA family oxidoreductase [Capsulimonadales bacterium]
MITFGVIGAGWRTDFFMRIAAALPDRFAVSGVVIRNADKATAFTGRWNVPTFGTAEEMLDATTPDLVVVSVPWGVSVSMLRLCAERGVPALGETPPAPDVEGLNELATLVRQNAKIQVAEQYFAQPLHAARLTVVRSGRIGTPSQAQVSVAHGYHGISLMRKYLGIRFENATITARRVVSPIVNSPGREGPPETEKVVDSGQMLAHFEFENGKTGLFDFTGDQYFSFIRGPRLLVRGERGEIENETVRFLLDATAGVRLSLQREDTGHLGNLEGYHHRGYTLGAEYVYRNPFAPGRLADDEIAIAAALAGTAAYAQGGPDFYSLADAAQDRYLDIRMEEAARTGAPVTTDTQAWAE